MLNVLKGLSIVGFLYVSILGGPPASCRKSTPVWNPPSTEQLAANLKSAVYQRVTESNFTHEARVALNSSIENGALRVGNDGMALAKVGEAETNARRLGELLNNRLEQLPTGLEGRREISVAVLRSLQASICPLYPFC